MTYKPSKYSEHRDSIIKQIRQNKDDFEKLSQTPITFPNEKDSKSTVDNKYFTKLADALKLANSNPDKMITKIEKIFKHHDGNNSIFRGKESLEKWNSLLNDLKETVKKNKTLDLGKRFLQAISTNLLDLLKMDRTHLIRSKVFTNDAFAILAPLNLQNPINVFHMETLNKNLEDNLTDEHKKDMYRTYLANIIDGIEKVVSYKYKNKTMEDNVHDAFNPVLKQYEKALENAENDKSDAKNKKSKDKQEKIANAGIIEKFKTYLGNWMTDYEKLCAALLKRAKKGPMHLIDKDQRIKYQGKFIRCNGIKLDKYHLKLDKKQCQGDIDDNDYKNFDEQTALLLKLGDAIRKNDVNWYADTEDPDAKLSNIEAAHRQVNRIYIAVEDIADECGLLHNLLSSYLGITCKESWDEVKNTIMKYCLTPINNEHNILKKQKQNNKT